MRWTNVKWFAKIELTDLSTEAMCSCSIRALYLPYSERHWLGTRSQQPLKSGVEQKYISYGKYRGTLNSVTHPFSLNSPQFSFRFFSGFFWLESCKLVKVMVLLALLRSRWYCYEVAARRSYISVCSSRIDLIALISWSTWWSNEHDLLQVSYSYSVT